MDSSDEELVILSAACNQLLKMKKRQLQRNKMRTARFWVNPYLQERNAKGRFSKDFEDLKANPNQFAENFHMDVPTFEAIFAMVLPHLMPKRCSRPDVIDPKLKFAVVLEFLASGTLPRHMASIYRISKTRMGVLIDVVCKALYTVLKSYISPMTKQDLLDVSNKYFKVWNFPNCLGAMDGKHVPLRAPSKSGSMVYNYKGFHSIVLFAVADPEYKFMYLDIGAYGSEGDANIFASSEFGKAVINEQLDFPEHANVGHTKVPFYFIGDDAFPLSRRTLKPYGGRGGLTEAETVFNYRLSRARRCVENAFGILCAKWLCLKRTLFCKPDRAQKIITACCFLHNYLMKNTRTYCPRFYSDHIDECGNLVEGEWRTQISALSGSTMYFSNLDAFRGRQNELGKQIREVIKDYVNSPEGSVAWQRRTVHLSESL